MLTAEQLGKKASEFHRTTGINYGTFEVLLGRIEAHVRDHKEQNPIHKRGLKPSFTLSQSLLLTLLYMRQYHTFLSLGQAFSISESYAQKRYCFVRYVLSQVLDMPATGLLESGTLSKVAADVSEQPIERPVRGQKEYYSGKKKHTVKALLVVCLITGLILGVYCAKGKVHDFKMWAKRKMKVHAGTAIHADLGFLGLAKYHPKTVLPFKASKLHPLTKDEKKHNRALAKERVKIEHVNRECKIFRIVKDTYRGKHKNYGLNWNIVAAINNLKKSCRHLAMATP